MKQIAIALVCLLATVTLSACEKPRAPTCTADAPCSGDRNPGEPEQREQD